MFRARHLSWVMALGLVAGPGLFMLSFILFVAAGVQDYRGGPAAQAGQACLVWGARAVVLGVSGLVGGLVSSGSRPLRAVGVVLGICAAAYFGIVARNGERLAGTHPRRFIEVTDCCI